MKIGPYETGRVYQGDCLELMKAIPDGAIDAVVTDPPYGVGLGEKTDARRRGSYHTITDSDALIQHVVLPAIEWAIHHVPVVVVTPGNRHCFEYPTPTEIGGVFCSAGSGLGRWGFNCIHPILYYGKDPKHGAGCYPNSFASNESSPRMGHPCPKPVGWMRWMVERSSLLGHVILDPFAGSGTTGVACVELGREFLGFEIDPDYCKLANDRIDAARKGITLKEHRAGQKTLFDGDK